MATPTRRNVLKLVFIAPAILMLGVAVQSKPNYIDYDHMISDKEADARVTSYINVVSETQKVLAARVPSTEKAREVAEQWIEGAKEGKLKPMPSQGIDDTMQMGAKSQIGSAAKELSQVLRKSANKAAVAGRYEDAANDYILAFRLIEPIRYSDVYSIALVDNHQRRTLNELKPFWNKFSPEQQTSLKQVFEEVAPNKTHFDEVARAAKRSEAVNKIQSEDIKRAMTDAQVAELPTSPLEADMLIRVASSNERANEKIISEILAQ